MRQAGRAALWGTLIVVAAACLPAPRVLDADTGAKTDAAGKADAGKSDSAATDATPPPVDTTHTMEPDTTATDSAASDSTTPADVVALASGCTADSDCAILPAPACQKVVCAADTGLCVLSADDDGKPCLLDSCTVDATCSGGTCGGTPRNCDDANSCTQDGCAPSPGDGNGCVHLELTGILGLCSDDDACSTLDACVAGACKGKPVVCDDQDPCTVDSCNAKSGACQHLPSPANASIACEVDLKTFPGSGPGKCFGNVCKQANGKAPCDDGNPCTKDLTPAPGYGIGGCKHLPLAGALCTGSNPCDQGVCALLDGKSACKVTLAYVDTPCQVTVSDGSCAMKDRPVGSPCPNPADLCHTAQCTTTASGLQCKATKSNVVCNDGNACTSDFCVNASGCQTAPNEAASCDDGNACTVGKDACQEGVCVGTPADCSDGNPCTDDSCDPLSGCSHTASQNGQPCGAGKACQSGACVGS
jgi:hypothetical protein